MFKLNHCWKGLKVEIKVEVKNERKNIKKRRISLLCKGGIKQDIKLKYCTCLTNKASVGNVYQFIIICRRLRTAQ